MSHLIFIQLEKLKTSKADGVLVMQLTECHTSKDGCHLGNCFVALSKCCRL